MAETTQQIAARCLHDAEFARRVLEGEEHPEVRSAIAADLEAERDVKGYDDLNPQPLPPRRVQAFVDPSWGQQSSIIWQRWSALPRVNLNRLAGFGGT